MDTVTKAFNFAVAKYGNKNCLGTRQILGETEEIQKNGKMFKKLSLGEYKWMNYNQTHSISNNFGRGLRELGIQPQVWRSQTEGRRFLIVSFTTGSNCHLR